MFYTIYIYPQTVCFSYHFSMWLDTLQARIETGLTLRQTDHITPQTAADLTKAGELNVYELTSVCLHFTLPETEVLNSLEELCIARMATIDSLTKVLNALGRSIYIVIYIYICVCVCVCVCVREATHSFLWKKTYQHDSPLKTSIFLYRLIVRERYIYIYIYRHPQTDCFVLSEHFSVARHAERSKPGSKAIQLYFRLSLRPLAQQVDYVGLGNS